MALTEDVIQQFVAATNDSSKSSNGTTCYGTVVIDGGYTYVRLDGSTLLTPVITTAKVLDGERVTVLLKNHTATITGNISAPSASNNDMEAVTQTVDNLKLKSVTTEQLEATNAKIVNLETTKLSAEQADLKYASVESLEAVEAKIDDLDVGNLDAKYATIESLDAVEAKIDDLDVENLDAKYATIESLETTNGKIATLESDNVTINETLTALNAEVEDLSASQITTEYLEANFANISLANVAVADIGTLFANVGLITSATIVNGHVTGYLDSVEVNANKITAGTLAVDRLIFRGENSIIYELNNITGALQAVQGNTLNGEILTDRSITVDKIVANSITANEIAAGTITASELNIANIFANSGVLNTLTAQEAFINAISTNSIVVGASNSAATALSTANEAKTTANTASTNASNAVTTANEAKSTASTASTNASNAVSTANTAKTTANTASTNASNAVSTANSAKSTATTASTNASNALSTANATSTKLNGLTTTENNITVIDGGKILTGSIKASKLDVDEIFSNSAVVNEIFAQDITATGTITGAKLVGADAELTKGSIGGWTIENDKLVVKNSYNEIVDGIFTIKKPIATWADVITAEAYNYETATYNTVMRLSTEGLYAPGVRVESIRGWDPYNPTTETPLKLLGEINLHTAWFTGDWFQYASDEVGYIYSEGNNFTINKYDPETDAYSTIINLKNDGSIEATGSISATGGIVSEHGITSKGQIYAVDGIWTDGFLSANSIVTTAGANLDTVNSRTTWRTCTVAASTTYGTFAAAPYAKYRYDENILEIVLIMGTWAAKATVAEGQSLCRITGLNVSIPHNSTCQVWDDSGQIYRRLTLGADGYVKLSSNTSIPTNYWLSFDNIRFTMRRA